MTDGARTRGEAASGTTRIKFCGLARREDVERALQLGADYLGFVFVPGSPRAVTPEQVARWAAACDRGASRWVGVFQDRRARDINAVVAAAGLDLVQLHGHEPRDFARALQVPALRVLSLPAASTSKPEVAPSASRAALGGGAAGAGGPGGEAAGRWPPPWYPAPNEYGFLLDSCDASGRSGGLGQCIDPARLEAVLGTVGREVRVFLSGGLTVDNVGELVQRFKPFAVDVSSGVETAPGRKDPRVMAAFAAAVRRSG